MNKQVVRFTVDLNIHDGKFDEFQRIVREMIAESDKEAGTLSYDFCLSADRKQCRLLETYADADAVLAHLEGPAVRKLVPKVLEASSVGAFEVYGDPGPRATQALRAFGAQIFPLWYGLSR